MCLGRCSVLILHNTLSNVDICRCKILCSWGLDTWRWHGNARLGVEWLVHEPGMEITRELYSNGIRSFARLETQLLQALLQCDIFRDLVTTEAMPQRLSIQSEISHPIQQGL